MASRRITNTFAQRVNHRAGGARQQFYWDTGERGLGLVVSEKHKSFIYRRRGRQRTIGRWPATTADEAREQARRLSLEWESELNKPPRHRRITLEDAVEIHVERMQKRGRSPGSIEAFHKCLATSLNSWVRRPLDQITPDDIRALHTRLGQKRGGRGGPIAANHAIRLLRAAWNSARARSNSVPPWPTGAIDFFPEPPRTEVVADVREWWKTVHSIPSPVRRTLHVFVLFTGLRSTDARTVRWDEIDVEAGTLHRPSPKGGEAKAFTVPLSDFVVDFLLAWRPVVQALYPGSPWVFPTRSGRNRTGPITVASNPKDRHRGLPSPHVLRHTYGTALSAVGADFATIATLLNHRSAAGRSVTMRYVHPTPEQLRPTQEALTRYLLDQAKRPRLEAEGVVVPLRRRRRVERSLERRRGTAARS